MRPCCKRSLVLLVVTAFSLISILQHLVPDSEAGSLDPKVPEDQLARARAEANPLPATEENLGRGKAVYEGKGTCYLCHGEDGKGYGPEAAGLDPPPQDFTEAAWQAARTDGELMWVLRHGLTGTSMPAFVGKGITEEEGWAVIHYIRQLGGSER